MSEDKGLPMWGCGVCGTSFIAGHNFDGTLFALAAPGAYTELAVRELARLEAGKNANPDTGRDTC